MLFTVSENWRSAYPGARAGILAMRGASNKQAHPAFEQAKQDIQDHLVARFAGQDPQALDAFGPLPAYSAYYKRFKKTYHVRGQLDSVVFKGKPIPRVAALVEAMFAAELKNGLLTAGHDLDLIKPPVALDVAAGQESYTRLGGQEAILKAGDMFMADRSGVISSIIYGPDQRTRITAATQNVLYTVYAPPGIATAAVQAHLEDLRDLVLIFAAQATVEALNIFTTE